VTSLEAGLNLDDLPMDCTKRETLLNGLQYLEVGLATVRWPTPVKWTSVKSRGTIVSALKVLLLSIIIYSLALYFALFCPLFTYLSYSCSSPL
jgi:hypothetical protein